MKASIQCVLACALLTACELTEPPVVPTPPPGPPSYVISGTVFDRFDNPLSGASVRASWNRGLQSRSTTSDGTGFFSIDGMWGAVELLVTKAGYPFHSESLGVHSNLSLKVHLKSVYRATPVTLPQKTTRLELATAVRTSTTEPPCDPGGWDATAPCRAFSFDAPSSGMLKVKLTFSGTVEMDVVMVSVKDLMVFEMSSIVSQGAQELSARLEAGQSYQIWVNSYYEPQEFELQATF